jgi:glycosyltransferase involved in cell wall biosynthesis
LSVINQSYKSKEYIIIDGGSNDGTLDIISKYGNRINYYLSEPDEGIYDAMNKGIKLASGDWIIFMNAGDSFVENGVFEKIIKEVYKYNENLEKVNLIYGNALVVNNKLGIVYKVKKEITGINTFYFSIKQPICHQAVLFNRSIFDEIGVYNKKFKLAGDYEWFVRFFMGKENYIAKFIDIDIVNFQMDGLSFDLLLNMLIERKIIAKKYFPFYIFFLFLSLFPFLYLKSKILMVVKETKLFNVYRILKYKIINFLM